MLAQIDNYYVVPVPFDVGDFYISGTGHLCARTPVRTVLAEEPVTRYGITSNSQIVGYATLEEQQRAGLDTSDPCMTAIKLKRLFGARSNGCVA